MQQQQREGHVAVAFLKLRETAVIPSRASSCSVGYDLATKKNSVTEIVPAYGKAKIYLGLRAFIQDGCYGRIAPCSSLSWYYHTSINAGVVHPDYRAELFVLIFNHGKNDLEIMPGQKIAQLILERCETPPVLEARMDPQTGEFTYDVITEVRDKKNIQQRKEEDGEINDDDEEDFSRTVDDDRAEAAAAAVERRRRSRHSNRRFNDYRRRSEKYYRRFKRRW